ncbi:MAG: PIN domain-containing protein [Candidatus Gracilibacteria bacterium]|nr:PIN domain-containing protein [Candidatus Gracilibacteria bacterium]MDD5179594.1 PIN domain-containing protein [Candidatus Gracilibacteria bacterium]
MNPGILASSEPSGELPINLFIDTNIFLDLYHFSKDDLNQLDNLLLIIDTDRVKLFLTDQLISEFKRNRESKIKISLKNLEEFKTYPPIPRICEEYAEAKEIREKGKNVEKLKNSLIKKIMGSMRKKEFKADKVIESIFSQDVILIDDKILEKAKRRILIGNPPGKNGSHGDAINWECLLDNVNYGQDLHLISVDRDYCSPIDDGKFSLFLEEEWVAKKSSKIIYYRDLSSFFKANFPKIKITGEDIKDAKIKRFAKSASFKEVRKNLGELQKIGDFSSKQIEDIVKASLSNGQITRCQEYSPKSVSGILSEIIKGHGNDIDSQEYKHFCEVFNIPQEKNLSEDQIDSTLDDILNSL